MPLPQAILRALSALLLALLVVGTARADVLTMVDGRVFDPVWVDSFTNVNGGGVFRVRAIADGQAAAEPRHVEARQVASIEFRTPAQANQPATGRRGALFMADGQELEAVWVERFQPDATGPAFRIRQAALDAGAPALPLAAASIARIYLGPPETIPLADGSTPLGLFSDLRPRPKRPTPQTPPPATFEDTFEDYDESYAEDFDEADEDYEDDFDWTAQDAERWKGGSLDTSGLSDIEVIMAIQKRAELEKRNSKSAGGRGGDAFGSFSRSDTPIDKGPLGLRLFGLTLGLLSILASMSATVVIGGIMLFLSSRAENIKDFPLWKAIITAGLLSIFPMTAFLLCLRYIPFFGLWLGLLSAYFTARAILMGMLEVLEEKATSTLISFFLIQFAVLILAAKFL